MSEAMMFTYTDDNGRCRDLRTGRFAKGDVVAPDETCSTGCERFGDWWVPEDCAAHLGAVNLRADR